MSQPTPVGAGPDSHPAAEPVAVANSARAVTAAALVIMVGNLLSRVVALVRDRVIAGRFSIEAESSLFTILNAIPTQIYDMLVGGLLSAALIPVFSEYAEADADEFWRIVSTIITVVLGSLLVVGSIFWVAPGFWSELLAAGLLADHPELRGPAARLLRLMVGAVLLMGLQGLFEAVLQAQRRFLLPALAKSLFNIGIVVAALAFGQLGVVALGVGMILGAAAQAAVQLPGLELRRLRPRLELGHPAVRRIGVLYLPVALGTGFSVIGTGIDRRLASQVSDSAAALMRYATTLVQFALGLIAAAIALSTLPTLARLSDKDESQFRRTFGLGVQVMLLLMMPTAALMAALARPLIQLIFQQGRFDAAATAATVPVLLLYLPSLLFAAIDQQLVFAFYARRQTLLPNLVQGVAVVCYLAVALVSYRTLGVYGLVLANLAQHLSHVACMGWLAERRLGLLSGQGLGLALLKTAAAALVAGGVAWAAELLLHGPLGSGLGGAAGRLAAGGGLGGLAYFLLLTRFKLEALDLFATAVGQRLRKVRTQT